MGLPLVAFLLSLLASAPARAGWLASGGLEYQTFSFRPLTDEPTPNYHGYGLDLGGGYSFVRVLDVQVYGRYAPSRLESAQFNSRNALMASYGATMGLRLLDTLYFGFGGGPHLYRLRQQTREDEITGGWKGMGGFVMLGAFLKIDRESYTQLALRFGTADLEGRSQGAVSKRKVDSFAVTMTYLWNAEDRTRYSRSVITDFVKSLNFF